MSLIYDGEDYYHLLGVSSSATAEQIRYAYRRLALLTHPDARPRSNTGMCFYHVKRAYEVLSDPASRAQYDRVMGFNQGSPSGYACHSLGRVFTHFFSGLERTMVHAADVTHELSDELAEPETDALAADRATGPAEEPRRMAG